MFVSVATSHRPATDLGFLLHKHPDRLHTADLGFGRATMGYPRADEEGCEFVLALDVDPVALVTAGGDAAVTDYVSPRPYAASSFVSVAISRCLGTALNGRSKERQALADVAIPLECTVAPFPTRDPTGGAVRRAFEPLGWDVDLLWPDGDADAPGARSHATLRLVGEARVRDLLSHLYVLLPALGGDKHYWISGDEVDKLVAKGGEWLRDHPERDAIVRGYMARHRPLGDEAVRALDGDDAPFPHRPRFGRPLHDRRHDVAVDLVRSTGAVRVADVGCSDGVLAVRLAVETPAREVIAVDPDPAALRRVRRRLEDAPSDARAKVRPMHGALGYGDRRLNDVDLVALLEVVEHLDPDRVDPAVDGLMDSRPRRVVVTTPNRAYNAFYGMDPEALRHPDHRFEWTRDEFVAWAERVAERHGYAVEHGGIGDPMEDDEGTTHLPTSMAVLVRRDVATAEAPTAVPLGAAADGRDRA